MDNASTRTMIQRSFNDILTKSGQLTGVEPTATQSVTLASAFITRGSIAISDFLSCISTTQKKLIFPAWNQNAIKIGMCSTPAAVGGDMSVLGE